MSRHHSLFISLPILLTACLLTYILTGCSSEYKTIGPILEGNNSITGGKMLLLAGKPGGSGTSDATGTLARFYSPTGMTVYGNNIYVTDRQNHTIRKIDLSTKSVTTLAGYPGRRGFSDGTGRDAGFNYPEGLVADGLNLFVTDTYNQVIRKVGMYSGEVTTLSGRRGQAGYSDGTGADTMFQMPSGITAIGSVLYVTDTDNQVIRRVDKNSGTTLTIAGSVKTRGSADGIGDSSRFNNPLGITTDGEFLFIADSNNHTIRRLDIQTGEVITLAGKAGESGISDGSLLNARFSYPSGLYLKGGELFVSEIGNDLIRVIDLINGTVITLAGTPRVPGFLDGPPGIGRFNSPAEIAIAGDYIYVTDMNNNTIRSVNISTGEIETIAGAPSYTGATDDAGVNSRFSTPGGIAIDGNTLYVADTYNHLIRKVDGETGEVTTIAGKAGVSGATDSSESSAVFNSPTDVIADESGNFIYIVDTNNHIIRSMNISTGEVRTFAGYPAESGSVNGIGIDARFKSPKRGVRINGKLYIADSGNHVIRIIDILTKEVTTLAGQSGVAGLNDSSEGSSGIAHFNSPGDITTDGTFLYVADTGNHAIRRVDPNTGIVVTISGSRGTSGLVESADGAPLFNLPEGITWHNDILYVSDTGNHIIRKINLTTGEVSLLAGDVDCVDEVTVTNGVETVVRKCTALQAGESSYGDSTDGTGKTTSFSSPTGINTDGTYLYVMDTGSSRIRRVKMNTGETATFSYSLNKGVSLNSPAGADLAGNILYVADRGNQAIRKLNITNLVNAPLILIAGNIGKSGYTYSAGYSASFYNPVGIVADGMGNLYVADTGNHTIRKVVISTREVTTIAGVPGTAGFVNSEFGYPMFNSPRGICIIGNHLYVADSGNHLIRRINLLTGYVGLVAGLSDYVTSTGSPGTADSTGAAAGFNDPRGITTDGKYLYVTDSGNHSIRRILASTGQVKTIAGMPGISGYKDGTTFYVRFNYPRGIAVDGDYLYVADTGNNVFRRVNKNTGEVLTLSGRRGESSIIQGVREDARYNNVVSVATSQGSPYLYFTDSVENVVGMVEK
ncbi:MAG: hypothetical protein IT393_09015 [Nitrospirae bacterium]|nr:hypothetical protein [Nitrospirota bacterium]